MLSLLIQCRTPAARSISRQVPLFNHQRALADGLQLAWVWGIRQALHSAGHETSNETARCGAPSAWAIGRPGLAGGGLRAPGHAYRHISAREGVAALGGDEARPPVLEERRRLVPGLGTCREKGWPGAAGKPGGGQEYGF